MSSKKVSIHYVNNAELLAAMIEFKKSINLAKKNKEISPRIPPYIGECIMKIATHLAFRPNFSNYPFRDEMISDGIENCLQYIENFDAKKSKNPFAYFTQIIYYAFIRRIQKEKKYLYIKHRATEMAEINGEISEMQENDNANHRKSMNRGEWSQEQMFRFMDDFEEHKRKKKKKKKIDNKTV